MIKNCSRLLLLALRRHSAWRLLLCAQIRTTGSGFARRMAQGGSLAPPSGHGLVDALQGSRADSHDRPCPWSITR